MYRKYYVNIYDSRFVHTKKCLIGTCVCISAALHKLSHLTFVERFITRIHMHNMEQKGQMLRFRLRSANTLCSWTSCKQIGIRWTKMLKATVGLAPTNSYILVPLSRSPMRKRRKRLNLRVHASYILTDTHTNLVSGAIVLRYFETFFKLHTVSVFIKLCKVCKKS